MSSKEYEYVSIAEKKAKAQKSTSKLKKKKIELQPVIIEGRKLARTWWGIAWNDNMESYSDYENRIGRGRSYVRNGAVLDLKIEKGVVNALVQGSRTKPYEVTIEIDPLGDKVWSKIKKECEGKIDSLQDLLEGKFPEALSDLFTAKGKGLFPAPKEISMDCSCPDWAVMCKHVASVFYGIGARLDQEPELFFTLRNVNMEELIQEAIQNKAEDMMGKAEVKSKRVLTGSDIGDMFGLELESTDNKPASEVKKTKTD